MPRSWRGAAGAAGSNFYYLEEVTYEVISKTKKYVVWAALLTPIVWIAFAGAIAEAGLSLSSKNRFTLNGEKYTARTSVVDGRCKDVAPLTCSGDLVKQAKKTLTIDSEKFCYQHVLCQPD